VPWPMGSPRWRRAPHSLRIDLCVHLTPDIGSPATASRSRSSKATRMCGHFFFDPLSAATGSADTPCGTLVGVGQLALAPPDGISAQAGDAGETGDAASALLLGQQANDQAPALLVQGSDQVVQGAMLLGRGPIGLTATARAGAAMDNGRFTRPIHDSPPPWAVD